jgi:hypothetical protein|tara:strand:- start:74 stop:208 length:135 start_codon:yes stop_codon:yes gene_type:complete
MQKKAPHGGVLALAEDPPGIAIANIREVAWRRTGSGSGCLFLRD